MSDSSEIGIRKMKIGLHPLWESQLSLDNYLHIMVLFDKSALKHFLSNTHYNLLETSKQCL